MPRYTLDSLNQPKSFWSTSQTPCCCCCCFCNSNCPSENYLQTNSVLCPLLQGQSSLTVKGHKGQRCPSESPLSHSKENQKRHCLKKTKILFSKKTEILLFFPVLCRLSSSVFRLRWVFSKCEHIDFRSPELRSALDSISSSSPMMMTTTMMKSSLSGCCEDDGEPRTESHLHLLLSCPIHATAGHVISFSCEKIWCHVRKKIQNMSSGKIWIIRSSYEEILSDTTLIYIAPELH